MKRPPSKSHRIFTIPLIVLSIFIPAYLAGRLDASHEARRDTIKADVAYRDDSGAFFYGCKETE